MDQQKFQSLKERVEECRRRADKASGVMEQIQRRFRDEYDCSSVEEAEELLARLEAEEKGAAEGCDVAERAFVKKYGERLE